MPSAGDQAGHPRWLALPPDGVGRWLPRIPPACGNRPICLCPRSPANTKKKFIYQERQGKYVKKPLAMSRVSGENTEPQRLIAPVLCEGMQMRPPLHIGKPLQIVIAVCTHPAMCVGAKGSNCSASCSTLQLLQIGQRRRRCKLVCTLLSWQFGLVLKANMHEFASGVLAICTSS